VGKRFYRNQPFTDSWEMERESSISPTLEEHILRKFS
jgi:hypothetical protein